MLQSYDITIATNQSRQIDAAGSFVYFYAGSAGGADPSITLQGLSSGLRVILKPGQGFRLPAGKTESSWIAANYAQAATIIGTLMVGDGDLSDNRVTGSVEVIDGEKARTLAGGAFAWRPTSAATVNRPYAQLWNPPGSGKNLIVDAIVLTTNQAAGLTVASHSVKLANAGQPVSNMRTDNATTTVAQPVVQDVAPITADHTFGSAIVPASGLFDFSNLLARPIVVGPGTGLLLSAEFNAATLSGMVSFFEEPQ